MTTASGTGNDTPRFRHRWARGAALAVALGLALGACGGDDDEASEDDTASEPSDEASAPSDEGSGPSTEEVAYEVSDIEYTDLTAPAGGLVEVTNSSGAPHTLTADDGSFDLEYGADETAVLDVPAEPGDYPFHCEIHGSMQATLSVE